MFVINRPMGTGENGMKLRLIVDIKFLNAIIPADTYPIPCQEDIIQKLSDIELISMFDVISLFY